MDEIFTFLKDQRLVPARGAVYTFEQIRDAVTAQDEGKVSGKIVVTV